MLLDLLERMVMFYYSRNEDVETILLGPLLFKQVIEETGSISKINPNGRVISINVFSGVEIKEVTEEEFIEMEYVGGILDDRKQNLPFEAKLHNAFYTIKQNGNRAIQAFYRQNMSLHFNYMKFVIK